MKLTKTQLIDVVLPIVFIGELIFLGLILFMDAFALDWRMALFENIDSHGCVLVLGEMISQKNFISPHRPFIAYGAFYYYLSYIAFVIREFLRPSMDILGVFMAERWISFIFAMASLAAYFPLQREYRLPKWFPYFAAFSTVTVLEFFYYSFFPKPETLQYFFILLTIIWLNRCRTPGGLRNLLLCTLFAGLAAAAKLGGVFYLPLIWVLYAINCKLKPKDLAVHLLLSLAVFGGVYLLLNLRWIFDYEYTRNYFTLQQERWNWIKTFWSWEWFAQLASFGYFVCAAFFIYAAGVLIDLFRKPKKLSKVPTESALALFALIYIAYLCKCIHFDFSQRYALVILPIMLMGAARVAQLGYEKIKKIGHFSTRPFSVVLIIGLLIYSADGNRIRPGFAQMDDFMNSETSDRAKAGVYLLKNYPPKTTMFFYFNWWVPAVFETTSNMRHCPFPLEQITAQKPDLILLLGGYDPQCDGAIGDLESGAAPYHRVARLPEDDAARLHYLVYERNDFKKAD